jgi:protease I
MLAGGFTMKDVAGKKVAILVADNFEQVEMTDPRKALDQAGVATFIVSPAKGEVKGVNHDQPGEKFKVDVPLDQAKEADYDAILIPGGLMSPDELRSTPKAVEFVKAFFKSGKPIFSICHGPWLLVEAGIAQGLKLTSWPAIKTDLKNAGADWVDQEVVTEEGIVTSRNPDDIPAFNDKIIEELAEGKHERHAA